ncbi:unnamed protein product [Caenorhabditis bovis]|uniref:Innexin n=1 Tax=Caenorhabditis bovis TaxID=2654633 RepID=A0A8S1F1M0_9PELO|nr:unnamed protein product [Caenorhabditis bovis]CAB3406406.1 unnamed protein product [Caenorhabditis bovis]
MFQLPFVDQLRSAVSYSAIDDFSDVLSCFATAFLLIFFAVFISAKTYVGSPIQCWFPRTYAKDWQEYAETYCFIKNTHHVGDAAQIDTIDSVKGADNNVTYYQWAAIYLTVMALGFVAPKLVWKKAQSMYEIPLLYFCETAAEIKMKSSIEIAEKVREMGNYMKSKLTNCDREMKTKSHLATIYVVIKLLYLLNIIVQFVVLSFFLGHNANLFWGIDIMTNLVGNVTWSDTGIFPRVTFCHFTIRTPIIQHHVVQCVLAVNEFNEKIFAFLWVWLILVGIATLIGIIIAHDHINSHRYLKGLLHSIETPDEKTLARFAKYLGKDGLLILSFVKSQSDIVASELAVFMFDAFKKTGMKANGILIHKTIATV